MYSLDKTPTLAVWRVKYDDGKHYAELDYKEFMFHADDPCLAVFGVQPGVCKQDTKEIKKFQKFLNKRNQRNEKEPKE